MQANHDIILVSPELHYLLPRLKKAGMPLCNINGNIYMSTGSDELNDFQSYWNNQPDNRPAGMQDGDGCKGVVNSFIFLFILFFVLLGLSAMCSGCSPSPMERAGVRRYTPTNPSLTPYEYQLNAKRNIKRKYRKDFAPKKSLRPSLR